jgi:hypothetical protein
MKVWYCPSWNGDWRLEVDPDSTNKTRLTIEKPTPSELVELTKLGPVFVEKKWLSEADSQKITRRPGFLRRGHHVTLAAPLSEVGPVVTSALQPGDNILTAIRFRDGRVEVTETNKPKELPKSPPYRSTDSTPPSQPSEKVTALAKREDAEKAVTVKRATPCCPDCYVDAVGPATDVLLSFLTEEQHDTWHKHRFLIVRGGITGHRYLIAHRSTPLAAAQRRITFDLEDRAILHFHDWTVPPEEEVLAAMLILRHREPWLRNEATCFGSQERFKNPFGDGSDGIVDSSWTYELGLTAAKVLG